MTSVTTYREESWIEVEIGFGQFVYCPYRRVYCLPHFRASRGFL